MVSMNAPYDPATIAVADQNASDRPDVSVLVITYNHEKHIARCLESVLMQRGADFEVIVSEDRSTDGTLAIARSTLESFDAGQIIASERNLASNQTILRALRQARGRYVSMIDGDDFWLADDKLARQVAILGAAPELAACFHNARIVRGDGEVPTEERWTPATQSPFVSLAELWEGNPFATCAGMLKRKALQSVGDWYGSFGRSSGTPMITDWPLYLACAEHGRIRFVDEVVGAYRLHDDGCYSSLTRKEKLDATARLYKRMEAGLGSRHERLALTGAASYFTDWMEEYGRQGERSLARAAAWHALRSGGVGLREGWRSWLRKAVRAVR
jgi:hypothetical protein